MSLLWLVACAVSDSSTSLKDSLPVDSFDPDSASTDSGEPPIPEDERADNLGSGPGDYAVDFLADSTYSTLEVEIDWVAGHDPDPEALAHLEEVLADVCNKPGGFEFILDDEIPDQGSPAWSYGVAEDLEIAWRDRYRSPDTGVAVLYYLYVDGHSDADTDEGQVLGYAYHGSSLIIFEETMESVSAGLLAVADVEPTVLAHEAGHVLGLVNNGVEMGGDHEDPEHTHHDSNEDCVMFWAAETNAITGLLGGGIPGFDEECRADMKAAGGR